MYQEYKECFSLENGTEIQIETGKLAKQADGSVIVRVGDTMIMATVVAKQDASDNVDFMPLSVDYQEKYASMGRFPGGFFKREARPSEYEILISRLIDRALRPMFPSDFHAETQVLVTLISADKNTPPDAYAALAASSALMVSDIPFDGPISEVRVAYINKEFIVNPTIEQLENAELDLMVAATISDITMVEGEMKEVSEELMIEALKVAHDAIKIQCEAQIRLASKIEKAQNKREYCHENNDEELKKNLEEFCFEKLKEIAREGIANKKIRTEKFNNVSNEFVATLSEEYAAEKKFLIKKYFHDIHKEAVRQVVVNERIRLDGRKLDEIRPIWGEVSFLPSAHGSSVFTRGETQSLTSVTLGTSLDEQIIDGVMFEGKSKLMLHYNFPPFSTGEVKMMRTSRREVGHGNLALRALKQVLDLSDDYPYTIRIVSDVLESNGSSSMATVCAGSMALMDAGVTIKKAVSGIAMGLIADVSTGKYAVLSDILGDEDHLGDMDFKVTGTKDGVTACQMDIKVQGLSYQILSEALSQANQGRMHILNEINKVISEPRAEMKPNVPRFAKTKIPREFIGAIIGPGGKIIQEMQRTFNATITIEEVGDFGSIAVFAHNKSDIDAVINRIKQITAVPVVGDVYEGTVKSILAFGAFVEILPGKEGLLHISEIDWKHVKDATEYLKIGDKVEVKLIEVDSKSGKMKLSRKVLMPREQ